MTEAVSNAVTRHRPKIDEVRKSLWHRRPRLCNALRRNSRQSFDTASASQPRKVSCNAGFTLAELIVATTLLTIVLTGVYTTFSTASRVWRDGEASVAVYEDARRSVEMFTKELHAVAPDTAHLMYAGPDWIEFYTLSAPMNVEDGTVERLMKVRYWFASDRSGGRLMRGESLVEGPLPTAFAVDHGVSPESVDLSRENPFELARDVEAFSLRYAWAPGNPAKPDEPPRPVALLSDDALQAAAPHRVAMVLALADPSGMAGGSVKTFATNILLRGPTSPIPKYLLDEAKRASQ